MNVQTLRVALLSSCLLARPTIGESAGIIQNFNSPLSLKVYAHYSSDIPDTVLGFTPVAKGHRIHINPGTFWYVRPQGNLSAIKLARLASDIRHFGIPGLDLSDHWELTDESLHHLRSLPSLRLLDLSRTRLTNACGPSLSTLTNLTILMLPESFSDRGFASLQGMHHLRDLSLDRTKIGDQGLKKIATLTMLENLDLSGTAVTDQGLDVLRQLPHLKRLVLGGHISDAATPMIATLKTLQHIDISQTRITDQGLAALATLPKLESVYLSRSIGDRGIKRLAGSPSLKSLDLSGSAMTDVGMVSVANIKTLQELDVSQTEVTDVGVAALVALPNLRMLELSDTHVTSTGVAALSKVSHLDILSLSWQTLSRQDLKSMSQLHQVKTMILNGVPLPSTTMAQLRRLNHASPWEQHVPGIQHAQLAPTSSLNDQVLTAPVVAIKPKGPASVESLTGRSLSAPLAREDASIPIAPPVVAVPKPGFWGSHVKTIFSSKAKPAKTGGADTLMAPQSPERLTDVAHPVASATMPIPTKLEDSTVHGGVSIPATPSERMSEDIAGGAPSEASGPAAKGGEDNLLKVIALQSDPSKHGGFTGLTGMKQIRAAEGSDSLNTIALTHDNRIETQEDKPENSLGEIVVGASH